MQEKLGKLKSWGRCGMADYKYKYIEKEKEIGGDPMGAVAHKAAARSSFIFRKRLDG